MSISPLLSLGIATSGAPDAYSKGVDLKQARQERRDIALQRKKEGDLQLQQLQHQVDNTPLQDQQLQQTVQMQQIQLQQLQKDALRKDSFTALDNFFDSGNPQSLNQFLQDNKGNPTIQNAFGGAVKTEQFDPSSPEDKQLLMQAGLSQEELDAKDGKADGKVDWDKLKARYLKVITSEGQTHLTDMVTTAGGMGYQRYASKQALEKMQTLANIAKAQKGAGPTALQRDSVAYDEAKTRIAAGTPQAGDEALIKRVDALNRPPAAKAPPAAPAQERLALHAAQAKERIAAGNPKTGDAEIVAAYKHEIAGTGTGKAAIATDARKQFKAAGYDKLSAEELQSNPEARALVNQIEVAHPITTGTQKAMTDLNAMVALSKEAGNLSSSQTGLFDSLISTATDYTSDDTVDKKAKNAYGAFINQFRHNLFGSALTEGELKAFRQAYNTNSQKIGPVLSGLRAALVQVKSKLQTITDFNAPEVIKLRGGTGLQDINKALKNVNQRLDFYNKAASGMTPDEALKAGTSNEPVPSTPEDISAALGF